MGQRLDICKDEDWEGVDWLASKLKEWATAISLHHPIITHDEHGGLFQLLTDGGADKPEPIILDVPGANKPRSAGRPFHNLLGNVVAETYHAEVRIVPNLNASSPHCLEVRFKYARVPPRHGKSDGGTASDESANPLLVLPVSAAERLIFVRVDQDGSGVDKREVRSFRRALGGYLDPNCVDAPVLNLSGDVGGPEITWQLGTVPRSRGIYWNEKCHGEDLRPQLLIALAQLGVIQVDERVTVQLERYLRKNFWTSIRWGVKRSGLTGKQVTERACAHILQRYSFPEHPHAFRMYVKRVLCWAAGSSESEYRPQIDTGKEIYTVPEAAATLRVSKDTLYRFIRQKKIHVQRDDGLISIPRDEFLKLAVYRRERVERRILRRELQDQQEKSPEAARKAVYRMRGRLDLPGDSHRQGHEPAR
jgi:excisionase family DNA binding protein